MSQALNGSVTASHSRLALLETALSEALSTCSELPVVAIRWMHLKHPLRPVQMELMAEGSESGPIPGLGELLWSTARGVVYAVKTSLRLVWLRWVTRRQRAALSARPFGVIAKTCCQNVQPLPDGRDFYYGDLAQRLAQRGTPMLLLCSDMFDRPWREFVHGQMSVTSEARLPEWCLVEPFAPIRLMWRQISASWRLRRRARTCPDPLLRRVFALAGRDCLLPDTAYNALNFVMAREAVRIWHPRAFLTFYEGHAWEACMWWGAKEADPRCQTVGYQTSVVFEESRALTGPPGNRPDRFRPDQVLASGEVSLKRMRHSFSEHRPKGLVSGNFRFCENRVEKPASPERRTVLVTPEGIESEIEALFSFAAACASRLRDHTFILRLYPAAWPPSVLRIAQKAAEQPNVRLSEAARLEEDCAQASVLLYRGSTCALTAAQLGLLPICLHDASLMDADPLYDAPAWRRRCADPETFVRLIREDAQAQPEARLSEWETLVEYLQSCTGPVTDEAVDRWLGMVGLFDAGLKQRKGVSAQ